MKKKILLTNLTDIDLKQAVEKYSILSPFFERQIPLSELAKEHGINLRTIQRWVQKYRKNGLIGLVRKERIDKGINRIGNPELLKLIEAFALQKPKTPITILYQKVSEIAQNKGWEMPSYRSVCEMIKNINPALTKLAHEGSKSYREAFDIIYRHEANHPNEICQADHTLLDILLLNEKGEAQRPWLTIIIDDYSRAIAGYRVGFNPPSSLVTSLTLRQAIWYKHKPEWKVCGIPEKFYTDHGSDFTSHHMEQVCADLKIELIFSTVGSPQGRGKIERFFRTVNEMLLAKLPGYFLSNQSKVKPKLNLIEFDYQFQLFLFDNYHNRIHSSTGSIPQTLWESNNFLPRLPESLEQLDLLLLTVAKTRKVHKDGIYFQGLRYIDINLAAYVGEEVIIRYDPNDMAEIRVYSKNQYICRAVCQEIAGNILSLKDIIRERNHRRKELGKTIKDHSQLVNRYLETHHQDNYYQKNKNDTTKSKKSKLKSYYNE